MAHSARVYDFWLGGKDNFAADRELGQRIVDLVPMTPASCRANRAFLHRAARMVAEAGVRQFLDLGAGLPTVENTHTVVQRVNRANATVYVCVLAVAWEPPVSTYRKGQKIRVASGSIQRTTGDAPH